MSVGATPDHREPVRLTPRVVVRSLRDAVALAVRGAGGWVAVDALLAVVAGALPVALAWLTKLTIDGLTGGGLTAGALGWLAVGMALCGVALGLAPQFAGYVQQQLSRQIRLRAQDRLFEVLGIRLRGLASLENPQIQDRIRIAQEGGSSASVQLTTGVSGIVQQVLTVSGFLTALFFLNPLLCLVLAAMAVPAFWAQVLISRRRGRALWRISAADRRRYFYQGLLTDPTEGKELRLFGLQSLFRRRLLTEVAVANEAERAVDRRELRLQSLLAMAGAVIAGAGLVWAVRAALAGQLTAGDVTVFLAAVAGVQGGVAAIAGKLGETHQALLEFDHYQVITRLPDDLPTPPSPVPVPALRRGIEFRDVWFRYAEDRPWILRGVNFTLPAGGSLALVGLNGAGKSTVVKLMCRFYDPTRGSVHWDGTDLRELDPGQLRDRISAVFQDFAQYELSAAENISLGDHRRPQRPGQVEEAARLAGVHELLSGLPGGYQTMLTRVFVDHADQDDPETGVLLSGGQGQRVALARALYRQGRDLLILDEPSSGLDAVAEHQIHTGLREFRAGRTSVLISHRLNTIRDADRIVVLEAGRITEEGGHRELLALNGTYAELFALQAAGYQEATHEPETVR
jgi:ATP-binding cassette, subfamily B, bacterial